MQATIRKFCRSKKPDTSAFNFLNYVGLKDLGQKQNIHGVFSEEQLYGLRPSTSEHTRFKIGYLPIIALICGIFAIDHLQARNYSRAIGKYRSLIEKEMNNRNALPASI